MPASPATPLDSSGGGSSSLRTSSSLSTSIRRSVSARRSSAMRKRSILSLTQPILGTPPMHPLSPSPEPHAKELKLSLSPSDEPPFPSSPLSDSQSQSQSQRGVPEDPPLQATESFKDKAARADKERALWAALEGAGEGAGLNAGYGGGASGTVVSERSTGGAPGERSSVLKTASSVLESWLKEIEEEGGEPPSALLLLAMANATNTSASTLAPPGVSPGAPSASPLGAVAGVPPGSASGGGSPVGPAVGFGSQDEVMSTPGGVGGTPPEAGTPEGDPAAYTFPLAKGLGGSPSGEEAEEEVAVMRMMRRMLALTNAEGGAGAGAGAGGGGAKLPNGDKGGDRSGASGEASGVPLGPPLGALEAVKKNLSDTMLGVPGPAEALGLPLPPGGEGAKEPLTTTGTQDSTEESQASRGPNGVPVAYPPSTADSPLSYQVTFRTDILSSPASADPARPKDTSGPHGKAGAPAGTGTSAVHRRLGSGTPSDSPGFPGFSGADGQGGGLKSDTGDANNSNTVEGGGTVEGATGKGSGDGAGSGEASTGDASGVPGADAEAMEVHKVQRADLTGSVTAEHANGDVLGVPKGSGVASGPEDGAVEGHGTGEKGGDGDGISTAYDWVKHAEDAVEDGLVVVAAQLLSLAEQSLAQVTPPALTPLRFLVLVMWRLAEQWLAHVCCSETRALLWQSSAWRM